MKSLHLVILTLLISIQVSSQDTVRAGKPFEWNSSKLAAVMADRGSSVIGVNGNEVFAIDSGKQLLAIWHRSGSEWERRADLQLPARVIHAVAIGEGLVVFYDGQCELISAAAGTGVYGRQALSSLPSAGHVQSSFSGKQLFAVVLPDSAAGTAKVYSLDLSKPVEGQTWKVFPVLALQNNEAVKFVKQSDGKKSSLYCISSTRLFKLENDQWIESGLHDLGINLSGATDIGPAHIIVYGSGNGSVDVNKLYTYHTITGKWVSLGDIPAAGGLMEPFRDGTHLVIPSLDKNGEISLVTSSNQSRPTSLHVLDYIALAAYFIILFFIGYYFSRRSKNSDDYFKGGKRVPWYVAGISIIAAKLSAVSFVSLPAKAFASNWTYFLVPGGNIAIAYFVVKYVIPFFCRLDVTSAYEYLEKRFNVVVRTISSFNFLVFELVKIGVLFIVPAVVLNVTAGIDLAYSIALIGITTTLYTLLGGMEGVVWTEAAQVLVMIGGTIIAILIIFSRLDGHQPALSSLVDMGKLKTVDFSWDFNTASFWVILIYWVGSLKNYISNQTIIQRYVSTRDEKQASKGIWLANVLNIPIIWLFLLLGTALFMFYSNYPEKLNPVMDQPDSILPWFIVLELPPGVSGLLIAGIFAASMSSLEASLNSMSTVFVKDFYVRFGKKPTDAKAVRLGKWLIVILGVIGTGTGLILASSNITSLYDRFFELIGLFGGGLGGIFLLGMMTEKGSSKGVLIGFVFSAMLLYYVKNYTTLNFFLYLFIGMMSCFIVGYLASFLFPDRGKSLKGLTIHTLTR